MGYRSQVRSMIYGDPDLMQALVASHVLVDGVNVFKAFDGEDISRYRMTRTLYDEEASKESGRTCWKDVEVEALDLEGEGWKWYPDYPDVKAWHALMDTAAEMGLNYEFVRIGEEDGDIERLSDIQDNGDCYLGTSSRIEVMLPDDLRNIEEEN